MPLRTTINVDVEAASLNESVAALSRFTKACEQSNSLWDKYGAAAYAAEKIGRDLQGVFDKQNATLAQTSNLHLKFATAGERVGKVFKGLVDDTKAMALNLGRIALSFVDIMSVFGIVGGLVGLGTGLFGADALAHVIAARRKAALRYGSNYGDVIAFGVDFARYGDTGSMLAAATEGMYDVTSPAFIGLRNIRALTGKPGETPTDVITNAIRNIPTEFAGVKEGAIGSRARALGLEGIFSNQEIARLRNAPPGEIESAIEKYKRDAKGFDISVEAQQKWADFSTSLSRAAQNMETIFGKSLSGLADPIGQISYNLSLVIDALSKSPVVKDLLNRVETDMQWFIDKVSSQDAKRAFAEFLTGMESLIPVTQKILRVSKVVMMLATGNYTWQQVFDAIVQAGWTPADLARAGWTPAALARAGWTAAPLNESLPYEDRPDTSHELGREDFHRGGSIRYGTRNPVGGRNYKQLHEPGSTYILPGGTIQTVPYPMTTFSMNGLAPIQGESVQQLATRIQRIYPSFSNQECVQLALRMGGAAYTPENVANVRAGSSAMDPSVPAGTPVGTFFSAPGVPSEQYAGGTGGRPGAGLDHMGIKWPTSDQTHLDLLNQWRGQSPTVTAYGANDRPGTEYAGQSYHVLLDARTGLPIGTWENNPMLRQVLAGIAANRFAKDAEAQNAYQERQRTLDRRRQLENRKESFLDTLHGAKDPKAIVVVDNSQGMAHVASNRHTAVYG